MSDKRIHPEYLKPGDEVAIISPSFSIDGEKVDFAVNLLKEWGLRVRLGHNVFKRSGPFAGTDSERLADLQEMTSEPSVKAVICSRGGYGISRIIDKVDFSKLKEYPKWYVGFSDITVLHMWLNEVYGLISVHAEMPLNYESSLSSEETLTTLKRALFGEAQPYLWDASVFNSGKATGAVTGGNLSLLCSLMGTVAEPDTRGKILFIEEVGEPLYHIDRMLTSLKLAGKLKHLSALIVGGMSELRDSKTPWNTTVVETIMNIAGEYGYPVCFNFPAGHIVDNRALYIGREAVLDVKANSAILTYT